MTRLFTLGTGLGTENDRPESDRTESDRGRGRPCLSEGDGNRTVGPRGMKTCFGYFCLILPEEPVFEICRRDLKRKTMEQGIDFFRGHVLTFLEHRALGQLLQSVAI